MSNQEVCGTCRHCRYDPADDDFFCNCEDSDDYMEFVPYGYSCDDWEQK